MISKIIEAIYPNFSYEQKSNLTSFLREQNIDVDEITSALKFVYNIYEHNSDVEFMFDKHIKTTRKSINCQYSLEQKFDLSVINVDVKEQTKNVALNEFIDSIKKEIKTEGKVYISTDKNFLDINYFESIDNPNITTIKLSINCKVLGVKDLRKMKLEKINSMKNLKLHIDSN